jgi:flagellar protein FliT
VGPVSQFYERTEELISILESADERDGKISIVEALLDERESLMKEMVPPFSADEVEVGKKLVQLNIRLMQLLQSEKVLIQKDIKNLQTKKESNSKYVNPYENLSTDGVFYDKRN